MSTTEKTRLFAAPEAITLLTFVPLALAGLLWFLSR